MEKEAMPQLSHRVETFTDSKRGQRRAVPLTTGITIRAYVITDEVYEHMVYAPDRLQKLPDYIK